MTESVEIGDKAPAFSLPSEDGDTVNIGDYLGRKPVVLFFYPMDHSSVCTWEVCAFRDNYEEFKRAGGAEVFGISSDSVRSHKLFSSAHKLPYKLLSDERSAVRELYGVPKVLGMIPGRVTYVIDRNGVVRHITSSLLSYKHHIDEAIETLTSLNRNE